jgi:hypothetical protein
MFCQIQCSTNSKFVNAARVPTDDDDEKLHKTMKNGDIGKLENTNTKIGLVHLFVSVCGGGRFYFGSMFLEFLMAHTHTGSVGYCLKPKSL